MRELSHCQAIERSIHKKYRKTLWNPFIAGVKRYELIKEGDRVAVCLSGGKDSALLAKLMQELHRHSDVPFELRFVMMDPGYDAEVRKKVEANAALLEIPAVVFSSDIFQTVAGMKGAPCYMCARMRRGHLYSYAKELGCNKIALGHHFNDVVETILLGMLYGAQIQTMMPKLKSTNFPGMELIRPLYCVREDAIIAWARYNALEFIPCACPLALRCGGSKRQEVKELLKTLRQDDKEIDNRIFQSVHMVNLDTVIGYKQDGAEHSFLEWYDEEKRGQ
ncbi:MAG: tRNA 2-thiocytidine biosynthesis protein TtcA [Oscillospiraceae bacterium]|jgi:tRNA(Ile)-lysidine synthase TilS/MesJ|nr:tRNA 2-thiocytidine biosynthesis protein TtcA [Oscillospiraceae bacterium]